HLRSPPTSTLFPYTTLFRSEPHGDRHPPHARDAGAEQPDRERSAARGAADIRRRHVPGVAVVHGPQFADLASESDGARDDRQTQDRKSTRLNSSHSQISYAV